MGFMPGLTPVDEPHGWRRRNGADVAGADKGKSMRGIAGERKAMSLMEGEKARRQVDVVFGIGLVGCLRQQGIRGGGLTKF